MANRYGVFGTSMTIRQLKTIIRKTEAIQKHSLPKDLIPPDFILISLDEDGKFHVREDYYLKKKINHSKTLVVENLQEYVFSPYFLGTAIIDMMNHPDGDLYSLEAGIIRSEWKIGNCVPFSLEFLGHIPGTTQSAFDVNIYKYD